MPVFKNISEPYYHKETNKVYGTIEYRSLLATHEINYTYSIKQKRITHCDEIAYGEWWDWDLKNLDESDKQAIEFMKATVEAYLAQRTEGN